MSRRLISLLCLVMAISAVAAGSALATGTKAAKTSHANSAAAALDIGVLAQLNEIRVAHHLVPLTLSPKLSLAAKAHSKDMLVNGYFAHNSSNGSQFWQRIQSYYPEGHFGYWSVGENLYWSSGSTSSEASMKAWMASPEHRANILNPVWRQIGIAAVSEADAPGTYAGLDATVITTDFGIRR